MLRRQPTMRDSRSAAAMEGRSTPKPSRRSSVADDGVDIDRLDIGCYPALI